MRLVLSICLVVAFGLAPAGCADPLAQSAGSATDATTDAGLDAWSADAEAKTDANAADAPLTPDTAEDADDTEDTARVGPEWQGHVQWGKAACPGIELTLWARPRTFASACTPTKALTGTDAFDWQDPTLLLHTLQWDNEPAGGVVLQNSSLQVGFWATGWSTAESESGAVLGIHVQDAGGSVELVELGVAMRIPAACAEPPKLVDQLFQSGALVAGQPNPVPPMGEVRLWRVWLGPLDDNAAANWPVCDQAFWSWPGTGYACSPPDPVSLTCLPP